MVSSLDVAYNALSGAKCVHGLADGCEWSWIRSSRRSVQFRGWINMATMARPSQRRRPIVDDLRVVGNRIGPLASRQRPVQLRSKMYVQVALRWSRRELHIIIVALWYSSYITMQIATTGLVSSSWPNTHI
jgi:hypothetical protein